MLSKVGSILDPFLFYVGVGALAVAVLAIGFPSESGGRILTDMEMARLHGDNPSDPCTKSYVCSQPFTSGTANCGYCQSNTGNNSRTLCCNLGKNTNCTYGNTPVCVNYNFFSGAINGQAGTCNTCTSNAYMASGACSGLTQGQGTACPP